MRIGIVGYGVVGKAIDYTISQKANVVKYDKFGNYDKFSTLLSCDFIFISVPTPHISKSNRLDDSAIKENLLRLHNESYQGIVLIKSTLNLNSCSEYIKEYNLRLIFNPEFLRESKTPNEDFANQDQIILGNSSRKDFQESKEMYLSFFKDASYEDVSYEEAEFIKLAQNMMLASRVALANIVYDVCKSNSLNYDNIKKFAFDQQPLIGPNMMQVPGPDGHRGFGGKCLPKDLSSFFSISSSKVVGEIIEYNKSLRDDLD